MLLSHINARMYLYHPLTKLSGKREKVYILIIFPSICQLKAIKNIPEKTKGSIALFQPIQRGEGSCELK